MKDFELYSIILSVVYSLALLLLMIRWKSPYILRRSPLMLIISLLGNLVQSLVYISQFFEVEKDYGEKVLKNCKMFFRVRQSLNVIFHYILFFPFVLRAYRMFIIFKVDKHWDDQRNNYSKFYYLTRQRWMFVVFLIFMIPFLVMVFIIITSCNLAEYLPASESSKHKLFSETLYLLISFVEQVFFILSIYCLRNISDDYTMTKELTVAAVAWFATPSITLFPPKNLKRFKSIPGLLRNVILFLVSSVYPIVRSFFSKNTEEILTLEMLESLESVLQSKLSLEQFEKFLKERDGKTNDSKIQPSGFELLHLYMKCENFMINNMNIDKDDLVKDIIEAQGIPVNFVNNQKDSFDLLVKETRDAVLLILRDDFFELFKKNWRFLELRRHVNRQEIYVGRLMRVGLTQTYACIYPE